MNEPKQNSQLVDWLMNASPIDLRQLDAEIAEQQAYLDKLKKSRRVLASIVGEAFGSSKKSSDNPQRGPKPGSKAKEHAITIAKLLIEEGTLRAVEIRTKTGLSSQPFYTAIASDWFIKTDDGYTLTQAGREAVKQL